MITYLKTRRTTLAIFALGAMIWTVVLSLYNLPLEPVLYAGVLYAFLVIAHVGFDYWHYKQRREALQGFVHQIIFDARGLPDPQYLLEKDYQELIAVLSRERAELMADSERTQNELIEYYTLWAHQIKTPISALRLLLQSEPPLDRAELEMQLFEIERYVDMVMQYLRVESASSDYVLKHHNLDDLTRKAVRKYAKVFIRKKIKLEFTELNADVLTDEKWLIFVIEQVLSNALKYTDRGSIAIYMAEEESKTLVIEDTGLGIPSEDLPRIFEKGFTGYNGRLAKNSSGIGLYLCKLILTKLSHSFKFQSEVGKGTKVMIGLDMLDTFIE